MNTMETPMNGVGVVDAPAVIIADQNLPQAQQAAGISAGK